MSVPMETELSPTDIDNPIFASSLANDEDRGDSVRNHSMCLIGFNART
jgi:hypothetical protein